MNLNDLARVWQIIKPSIEDGDPREAADLLVNHLTDDGMTATEIKKAFGKDEEIIEALSYFSDEDVDAIEEDEDTEEPDDDWD
jgi:hypothetical protein|tara:strand:+ start:250 stop:498 length:249 start_codon:yes stop_codon:yes gene_type:complete